MKPVNRAVQKIIGFAALALLSIPPVAADVWDKKTNVKFSAPVEFPGGIILAPGDYVMKLLNSSTDRHIVQVYNQDQDRMFAMVMANPAQRSEPADKTIITFYETPNDRPTLIHTWFYPGDTVGQEFSYPKSRVRYLATSSAGTPPLIAAAASIPVPAASNFVPADVARADSANLQTPPAQAVEVQPVENVAPARNNSDVAQAPAEEPVLLAQATPRQDIPQTPRVDAAADEAAAPATQLPATASDAPYWAASSLVLLAGAFLVRTARRVRS